MNSTFPRGRIGATSLFVMAAVALAFGLWAGSRWMTQPQPAALQAAVMYPIRQPVGAFDLHRSDGKPMTRANLDGHWTIAFFGFTHCPDVCPTTLAAFKQVWQALTTRGKTDRVQFLFVSVDPERDTPEQLCRYVDFFNKEFIAATGTDDQLTALTRSLGLVYARIPDESGGYSVDHSASAVIIDPQGRRAGLFRPPVRCRPDQRRYSCPYRSPMMPPSILLQYLLPHRLLSRIVFHATRWTWKPWKNFLIRLITRRFNVDMSEAAASEIDAYPHFNAFFTRELRVRRPPDRCRPGRAGVPGGWPNKPGRPDQGRAHLPGQGPELHSLGIAR